MAGNQILTGAGMTIHTDSVTFCIHFNIKDTMQKRFLTVEEFTPAFMKFHFCMMTGPSA